MNVLIFGGTGLLIYFFIPYALKIFGSTQEAVAYGSCTNFY